MQILINVPNSQHKNTRSSHHGQIAHTSDKNNIISVIQDAILAKMKRTEIGFRKTQQQIRLLKQNTTFPQTSF